jgi:two-component system cell cycle sensor histidine kinase/response regulator CckA
VEQLSGNPLIMYIDDESLLREVASLMIEDYGGRCVVAVDGHDAIEKFAEQPEEYSFVYVDYSMPDMNGYETILELRKIRPNIPIVVVSGLEIAPEVEDMCNKGEVGFLKKPFREEDLLSTFNKYAIKS